MQQKNQQQRKYYVAEPSEYPMVPKFNFSQPQKEQVKDAKKLFILEMLNKFGNGWRNLKVAKPKIIAIV